MPCQKICSNLNGNKIKPWFTTGLRNACKEKITYTGCFCSLDLLDLKLLLVIQRRGHTAKNSTPGDAMIGDTSCLSDGKVDDCEVVDGLLVASSRLCPGRSYAVSALHFRVAYAADDRTSAIGAASR